MLSIQLGLGHTDGRTTDDLPARPLDRRRGRLLYLRAGGDEVRMAIRVGRTRIRVSKIPDDRWDLATYTVTLSGEWIERLCSVAAAAGTAGSQFLEEAIMAAIASRDGRERRNAPRGAGALYLRGKVWWAKLYDRGHVRRFSTGERHRRAAEKRLELHRSELSDGTA